LMIDESQNLVEYHYSMLKVFVDELIDLKLSPFLLQSAQPEIQQRPEQLLKENLHDLVDRFFTRWHRMRGLQFEELPGVLGAYDSLRWTADKNSPAQAPTFTEFFAPRLARSGGLVTLAPQFFKAFREINRAAGRLPDDELETKYVVSAIRVFLIDLENDPNLISSADLTAAIEKAVRQSGILENRRRVGDAEQLFKNPDKRRARLES